MLSAPPRVRAQLSEALSLISAHDFPARWPSLLPHLVDKLASPDPQLVNGVLSTADSIYQRYRWAAWGVGVGGCMAPCHLTWRLAAVTACRAGGNSRTAVHRPGARAAPVA